MVVMSVLPFRLLGLINLVKSKTFMLLRGIHCIQCKGGVFNFYIWTGQTFFQKIIYKRTPLKNGVKPLT